MKIAIISDIHSNLEALENVLKDIEMEGVDHIFCLGDIVGYGPNPNECIEMVLSSVEKAVMGNHDYAAADLCSARNFNDYAKEAIYWTRDVLKKKNVERVKEFPFIIIKDEITLVHSSPHEPHKFYYLFSESDVINGFGALKSRLCFVGHTHTPVAFVMEEDRKITALSASNLTINEKYRYIINVGSVGQPRDGDNRSCYGIFDTSENRFYLRRVEYPIKIVQNKMRYENLPYYLIERLSEGR